LDLLDIRSVLVINIAIGLSCFAMAALLWRQGRARFAGLGFIAWQFALLSASGLALILRGTLPEAVSVSLVTPLSAAGSFIGLVGLERFLGIRPPSIWLDAAFLALVAAAHLVFAIISPSLQGRTIVISSAFAYFSSRSAGVAFGEESRALGNCARQVGITYLALIAINAGRIIENLLEARQSESFFHSPNLDAYYILLYTIALCFLVFSFSRMLNARILYELEQEETKFAKSFKRAPYAIILTRRVDGKVLDANESFERLTGHRIADAIGRTTLELGLWANPEDRAALLAEIGESGSVWQKECKFERADGSPFTALLSIETMRLKGEAVFIAGFSDISAQKASSERIERLLADKELLLREVHHRVKNNMNVAISILSAQEASAGPEAAVALKSAQSRLRGMALLFDKLYRSMSYESMEARDFLEPLVKEISESHQGESGPVAVELEVCDVRLPPEALSPIGIMVNELVSNAFKHAFKGRSMGHLSVKLEQAGPGLRLTVSDDGAGLPGSFDPSASTGFGMTLASMLAEQLGGRLEAGLAEGGGARFSASFPMPRHRGDA
jgi:PAS domain S-box-containing protein